MKPAMIRFTCYGIAFCIGACFAGYGVLAAVGALVASQEEAGPDIT